MKQLLSLLLLAGICLFTIQELLASPPSNDKPTSSCEIKSHKSILFKNINTLDYYDEKETFEKALKATKKDKALAYEAMTNYISLFGPTNFKNDSQIIWDAAKLAAELGYLQEAADLYKLVLRHYHTNIDFREVKHIHDSLNKLEREQYISLEYYHKIGNHSHKVDKLIEPQVESKNLGNNVNSPGPDYAPVFHSGSNSLIFTSQRGRSGINNENLVENLYISRRDDNGKWSKATILDNTNSTYNEGSGCLDKEGKTLYFSRCNSPDSYGNCDLFVAYLQDDGTWGKVKNMGIEVNSQGWDSHPTLSPSGDTLYFASDRSGGFGQTDIYYTYRNKLGKWVTPKNMGPVINTRHHDLSPFYHPEYPVLYFSSNGQPNSFGQFDIFKVSKKCDHLWGAPANAGPYVNHPGSEMYFSLDTKSNLMFFARSSNHQLQRQDLYSFPLPMEAHPASTTTLKGTLTDSISNQPLKGIVSIIDMDSGIEIAPKSINDKGEFEFNLIDHKNYVLVIRGKDFFRVEQPFFLDGPTNFETKTSKIGSTITFSSINFDFDSATVKDFMLDDLNKVAKFLFDNPEYLLRIEGHTDSEGSNEYNLDLSQRRAGNIREYLIAAGVDGLRIKHEGFGNMQPLVKESSSADKAKNRRVEFHLFNPDPAKEMSTYTSYSKR